MKYNYHGQVLDHDFLDGGQGDWNHWRKTGSNWFGQCSLVDPGGTVTFMDDYAINMTALSNAIEDIIHGSAIDSSSLGELKATFK